MRRRSIAAILAVGLALAGTGVLGAGSAHANPAIDGTVVEENLSTRNGLLVFVPAGTDNGYRAASTPILLVFGDGKFTAETAKRTAQTSGLGRIAATEQGVVAFINPEGAQWASGDAAAVTATLDRFGDNTGSPYSDQGKLCGLDFTGQYGCKYPGSKTRVYLFADRSGADFVNQNVLNGLQVPAIFPVYTGQMKEWTPAAVYISNATRPAVAPSVAVEVPAVVVNSSRAVEASYRKLNSRQGLFHSEWVNSRESFAEKTISCGYDNVIQFAIQRIMGTSDHMESYQIPDYGKLGVRVEHASFTVDGQPLEYFQYTPRNVTHRKGKAPLVVTFHGGGNHAEYQVWSTGWAELGSVRKFVFEGSGVTSPA